MFLTVFPLFMPKKKSLPSLFAKSLFCKNHLEWFTPVTLYKRATVRDSLKSFMTKERREPFTLFRKQIALPLFCSQKMSKFLEKPMSEFPTLVKKMVCPHCPKNKLDPRIKNKIVTSWGGCNQTLTVASAGVFIGIFILLGQCCGQTVQGFNCVLQWLVVAHAWFMRIFILLGQCCGQQCKANCVLQGVVVVAHAVSKAQIPHYCTLIQGFDVFTFQVSTFRLTIWALNWIISNNWF